jgi:hypothetical protein
MRNSFRATLSALLVHVLFAGRVFAGEGTEAPLPPSQLPEGVRVELTSDKPVYHVGEPALLMFTLINEGNEPFSFDHGGDYRGSGRALRYAVTAVREDGLVAADPNPNPVCMGGLGGEGTLNPGERWTQSLSLLRYRTIAEPGVYAVMAGHDLGLKLQRDGQPVRLDTFARPPLTGEAPPDRPAQALAVDGFPKASVRLEFQPVTPEAARAVVEELAGREDGWMGWDGTLFADFEMLRHPAYADALNALSARRAEAFKRVANPATGEP